MVSFANRTHLETISRNACKTAYFGDGVAIVRILDRLKMWVDTRDVALSPHLCLDGYWESWVTLAMLRALQPGWNCIDVGAHLGYYTLIMADAAGPSGRVIAVEPNPRLRTILGRSIATNGLGDRTVISDRALSDTDDEGAQLVLPMESSLNGSIRRAPGELDETIQVHTATLDTITDGLGHVDLVKIDAEGSEEAIWAGGMRTLRLNPRIVVIMEINCVRYEDPARFLQAIESEGFPLRYIEQDGSIQPVPAARILAEWNSEDLMLYLQR